MLARSRRILLEARERRRRPGTRRQGAGGLERPDDRGPGRGFRPARPTGLAGPRRRAPSPPSWRHMSDGDAPVPQLAGWAAPADGVPRRLCADEPGGTGPVRADRRRGLSRACACAWVDRCRDDFHDEPAAATFSARTLPTARSSGRRTRMTAQPRPPTAHLAEVAAALAPDRRRRYRPLAEDILAAFAGDAAPQSCRPCHAAAGRHPARPSRCRSWLSATRPRPASPTCSPPRAPRPSPARILQRVAPDGRVCRRATRLRASAFSTARPPPMSASAPPARRRSPSPAP